MPAISRIYSVKKRIQRHAGWGGQSRIFRFDHVTNLALVMALRNAVQDRGIHRVHRVRSRAGDLGRAAMNCLTATGDAAKRLGVQTGIAYPERGFTLQARRDHRG
jgi:hypothetical protein